MACRVCLARGRSFTVPLTPIIEDCDHWHQSALADVWDGSLVSSAVLRRELVSVQNSRLEIPFNMSIRSTSFQMLSRRATATGLIQLMGRRLLSRKHPY